MTLTQLSIIGMTAFGTAEGLISCYVEYKNPQAAKKLLPFAAICCLIAVSCGLTAAQLGP